MVTPLIIAAVAGYLLGALPFGYLVARAKGINIFEHGSKNPGATNVKRVLGEKFGAAGKRLGNLVFALDALKGAAAAGWPLVLAATLDKGSDFSWVQIGDVVIVDRDSALISAVTGLVFALVGHSFSCWTGFRGGKGVATASGGFLVLMPVPLLLALGVWIATFYTSRYVSLASILAALALPVAGYFLKQPPLLVGLGVAIALFVVIRHRTNISRLLNGTESKFAKKTAHQASAR